MEIINYSDIRIRRERERALGNARIVLDMRSVSGLPEKQQRSRLNGETVEEYYKRNPSRPYVQDLRDSAHVGHFTRR